MTTAADDPFLRVRGAREHNLANVDVDVPRDSIVVFTGISGSGKSSLAFGTIYGEAQRRYLESIAPYARRLIEQAGAPRVDDITGLPPAIALRQSRGAPTARSSVGTVTTMSSSLRMLLSRCGDYPSGAARLDSDAFSANTVAGACPSCHGLGRVHEVSEQSLVPDPSLSIRDGAIAAWPGAWQGKNYRDILAELGYDVDKPWSELPEDQRQWILFTDEQPVVTVHAIREAHRIQRPYQGTYASARRYVLHTYANTQSATLRKRVSRFLVSSFCPACGGKRLRPEALAVRYAGRDVTELAGLALTELDPLLARTIAGGDDTADRDEATVDAASSAAALLIAELHARIEVLTELGLGYLSLDRATPTLSSGELQRLRLASQLRSGLFGVLYVLDEPSAGLHPADTKSLLTSLDRLRAAGNSVLVVEHDLDVIRHADWLVDVGPGPGSAGGRVLHSGPVPELVDVAESVTRRYLFADDAPAVGARADKPPASGREPSGQLRLRGITRHNLQDVDLQLPLGVLTAVTGVSGSGKSTLISQVVAEVVTEQLRSADRPDRPDRIDQLDQPKIGDAETDGGDEGDDAAAAPAGAPDSAIIEATGLEQLRRLVRVDQRPIGRTPRSNLATYTGLFDSVRTVFAQTPLARERKYRAGRFSFNVKGGRCETCQGDGIISIELLFLPQTYAPCPDCRGARYNEQTLQVHYRGLSIAEVLALSVDEAADFLSDISAAARSLRTLAEVGLGYLTLGQPATTLSGGEAQRIKLATELQRSATAHTLYLLDEPTTGLHPADVELLMAQLHGLVDSGHTVVVIEHDMAVAAGADWVIDLGPGGGAQGGRVVATGRPAEVAAGDGATAAYLRARLDRL